MTRRHRITTAFLTACAMLFCLTSPAAAEIVDEMDDADRVEAGTPVTSVEAVDGTVRITKTKPGDAFARWGKRGGGMLPMGPETEAVEIEFDSFPGGGGAEVRLAFLDGRGQWAGGGVWKKLHREPGVLVLPSVAAFAEEQGIEDAGAFQLFFRVMGGPDAGIVIKRIRVADEPSTPAEPSADEAPKD